GKPRLHSDEVGSGAVLRRMRGDDDPRRMTAINQLCEVELGGSFFDLAIGITSELLAYKIRPIERLIELVDAVDFKSTNNSKYFRPLGGGVKEAFRGHSQPLVVICDPACEQGDLRLLPLQGGDPDCAISAGRGQEPCLAARASKKRQRRVGTTTNILV